MTDGAGPLQERDPRPDSVERIRDTFDRAGVGIAHVALDGRWLLVNDKLCEILAYSRADLLATTVQSITHPADIPADQDQFGGLLFGTVDSYATVRRCIRKDGSVVWTQLTMTVAGSAGQIPSYIIVVIEDVSTMLEAEQLARRAAERQADRTARMQAVTAALAEALTPADAADIVVHQGIACMGANAGSVALVTEDGAELEVIRSSGYPNRFLERSRRLPLSADLPITEAVRSREPIWIESFEARSARFRLFNLLPSSAGLGAVAAIPLIVDGRAIGALGLNFPDDRKLEAEDRSFMLDLARQCAQAFDRTRLYQAERAARAAAEAAQWRLSFLADASAVLGASLDYEEILDRVAHLTVPDLADWCLVHIAQSNGAIRLMAAAHIDPAREQAAHALDEAHPLELDVPYPIVDVVRSDRGALLSAPDGGVSTVDSASGERPRAVLQEIGFTAGMCVPLVARGRTLGTLTLLSETPDCRYSQDDLTLAEDLARRAALAADNARLYREAQQALAVREEFLTSISHDLRTPLTSAKGFAQLLQRRISRADGVQDPKVLAEGFETIDGSLTRMAALVAQLLDLSRLQTGRQLDLERAATDLVALSRHTAAEHERAVDSRHIQLHTALDTLVGHWDAARLERVLGNLLSNAIKYSPSGGDIAIRISRGYHDRIGDDVALLTIEDHGIGIPRADLPRVFDRFHRGSNVIGRIAGTGIGMAGARQIVEQHGGTMTVTSEENAGTTVTVVLPLTADGVGGWGRP